MISINKLWLGSFGVYCYFAGVPFPNEAISFSVYDKRAEGAVVMQDDSF